MKIRIVDGREHLRDGGVVIYPNGAMIGASDVRGNGQRYDLGRAWIR